MIDNTFFTKFLPTACSTLIFSLGLSATTGKGGANILRDEFYRMRLVMDSAADKEINRTFVLIGMRNGVRSLNSTHTEEHN
ncbi:hypothetical protein [Nostoc sp. 'Lobaria pulmonaria (5183) cyanobiont']|uniref:hypothetical protein n=1 Tax=Nostoc sp. 'Lobaria pulmonaria (5183) cyanobiont' TaxID=1618022 RepID=UPI000CF320AF|nr:hypothetical protein [Nostoc sp. 'Lobaria pulmonaria (5183) cyanobiont']